jgi:hypothetical protein
MGILRLSPDDLPDADVQVMALGLSERRTCRAEVVQTEPDPGRSRLPQGRASSTAATL